MDLDNDFFVHMHIYRYKEKKCLWLVMYFKYSGRNYVAIISVVTREKIGYGDSLVFLAIGLIIGGEKCFVIIFWSFLLCSIFSLVAIILKKTTFKSTVAFMPFVLAGALVTFISTQ